MIHYITYGGELTELNYSSVPWKPISESEEKEEEVCVVPVKKSKPFGFRPGTRLSRGERACKRVIERISGKPFSKIRPHWTLNPVTGRNMELDLYNEDLKIAVEFNGRQHYEFVEHFHKTYSGFRRQQDRDDLKKKLCKERGVKLIRVPYNARNIERYIRKRF